MANKILGQFSYGSRAQRKRVYGVVCILNMPNPMYQWKCGGETAWTYMKSNRRHRNNLSKAIKERNEIVSAGMGPNKQNAVAFFTTAADGWCAYILL